MMDFRPITKESVAALLPFLQNGDAVFCDFSPANLYVWAGYFYKAYAIADDLLFLQLLTEDGGTAYAVPMGSGDKKAGLRLLKAHAEKAGEPLVLSLVAAKDLPLLREVFGELHHVASESEWSDYIYDAQKMAAFEGSAYAKQRNHVRRFERQYPDYRVEKLTEDHLPMIEAFLKRFPSQRGKEDDFAFEEVARTETALRSMDELQLFGVVLFVGDTLAGFSAGSRLGDMLVVNFEKADTTFDGVYQMLVKCFASYYVDDTVRLINREEDCGDEGLRKSKLAYHPITLLEKYTVEIN